MDGEFMLGETDESFRSIVIYIAHPPDQRNFVDEIKKIAKELKIFSGSDSFNWISKYLDNCAEFKDDIRDVHSMIDQQLCLHSRVSSVFVD